MVKQKYFPLTKLLETPLPTAEAVLDVFKRASRKGISLEVFSELDFLDLFDKVDDFLSLEQTQTLKQYLKNGENYCKKRGRDEDSQLYGGLSVYVHNMIASKLAQKTLIVGKESS